MNLSSSKNNSPSTHTHTQTSTPSCWVSACILFIAYLQVASNEFFHSFFFLLSPYLFMMFVIIIGSYCNYSTVIVLRWQSVPELSLSSHCLPQTSIMESECFILGSASSIYCTAVQLKETGFKAVDHKVASKTCLCGRQLERKSSSWTLSTSTQPYKKRTRPPQYESSCSQKHAEWLQTYRAKGAVKKKEMVI